MYIILYSRRNGWRAPLRPRSEPNACGPRWTLGTADRRSPAFSPCCHPSACIQTPATRLSAPYSTDGSTRIDTRASTLLWKWLPQTNRPLHSALRRRSRIAHRKTIRNTCVRRERKELFPETAICYPALPHYSQSQKLVWRCT